MTSRLFEKAVVITDTHFGRQNGSAAALQDNLDFLKWATDRAKSWGATSCVFMGDWYDSRYAVTTLTMAASLTGIELLNNSFPVTHWFGGNHDMPYRSKRDGVTTGFAKHLPNINFIHDPATFDNVTFLPWLIGDEAKNIGNLNSRYVFGHLEVPGFLLNSRTEMPENEHTIDPKKAFKGVEHIFTGHFHKRQTKRIGSSQITYTGNIFPSSYSDVGDGERGIMLLAWGNDPIFEAWPDQPLFSYTTISQLLENPGRHLRAKMSVRAKLDVPLIHEETSEIKEALIATYGLRKIEFVAVPKDDIEKQSYDPETVYRSVDQIVIEGLMSIESSILSKDKLIDIYISLGDQR